MVSNKELATKQAAETRPATADDQVGAELMQAALNVSLNLPTPSTDPAKPDVWGAINNGNLQALLNGLTQLSNQFAQYLPSWQPSTAYAQGALVLGPAGSVYAGQPITANNAFTSGASFVASNWTSVLSGNYVPRPNSALEGVQLTGYGHSYLTNGSAQKFFDRLAARARMLGYTNHGVGGQTSDQMVATILDTFNPGTVQGLVGFCILQNDVELYGTDAKGPAMSVSTMRAALAAVSAVAKFEDTSAAFVFTGSGWSATTSDPLASVGTSHSTSHVGDTVDVGFTGDSCWVLVRAQSGACTVTETPTGTATVKNTYDLSGRFRSVPHVIKLSGYGAGTHTARLTLTGGGPLVVDCVMIPSSTPPALVFVEEGDVPGGWGSTGAAASNAYLNGTVFPAVEAMIAADFPSCVIARFTPGWDPLTMTVSDGDHLNDRGNAHVTDNLLTALAALPFSTGLNTGTTDLAVAPAVVTPSYSSSTGGGGGGSTPFARRQQVAAGSTQNGDSNGNVTLTLPSAPVTGNTLIAYLATAAPATHDTSDQSTLSAAATAAGWTVRYGEYASSDDWLMIATKPVGSGATAAQTIGSPKMAGTGVAVVIEEVAGLASTMPDASATTTNATTSTSAPCPQVTTTGAPRYVVSLYECYEADQYAMTGVATDDGSTATVATGPTLGLNSDGGGGSAIKGIIGTTSNAGTIGFKATAASGDIGTQIQATIAWPVNA